MQKELRAVITLIETSTGKAIKVKHEEACQTLLAVNEEIKRLEGVSTILKSALLASDELPYLSPEGEIRKETRKEYMQDVKAIRKELPRDVFYNAASVSKSKLEDRQHVLIVEKYTSESGETSEYIRIYPATKATKLDVNIKLA